MQLSHISRIAMGRAKPTGGYVDDAEWVDFERNALSEVFPDGFTVILGSGAWRDVKTGETIHEDSIIVEVAHDGSPQAIAAVRAVAGVYKALFHQDSVMVTTVAADVEFV